MLQLIRDLCKSRGMGVLLVTHDLGVMSSVADRISVFYAGRVVESGPTRDVLAAPRHPYTAGLLAVWASWSDARIAWVTNVGPRSGSAGGADGSRS